MRARSIAGLAKALGRRRGKRWKSLPKSDTPEAKALRSAKAKADKDKHEAPFAQQLLEAGLRGWEREHRFAAESVGWDCSAGASNPPPKLGERMAQAGLTGLQDWRLDFAHPESRLAVEIEGGGPQGRHQTPSGFHDDIRKYLEASLLGWRVLRVTGKMVHSGVAIRAVQMMMQRASEEEKSDA